MSVQAIKSNSAAGAALAARIDLAAAHRLAVLHELDEAIDNHFTVTLPGHTDRYLGLPYGLHWSEAKASNLIVFGADGKTIEGQGEAELSTVCIHEPIHRLCGAPVVLHTHQTWSLALNMLKDNRLVPTSQSAAFFHGRVAYDDHYEGTADYPSEGERLAPFIEGNVHTVFLKNHGVLVVGDNVAQAYRRLYMLERVCRAQVIAMSTGQELAPLAQSVIDQVQTPVSHDSHTRAQREQLFFDAMKRLLDREMPGYDT